MHRNSITPHFSCIGLAEYGYIIHMVRARNNANIGEKINGRVLAYIGIFSSFVNNFTASAIGWGMPDRATLLGPFRSWT